MGNGVDPLMLQEVAHHPDSGWLRLLQLFLSGRPIFLLPIEARVLQLRLSCQVAGGGGVQSPNGEVDGDRITGGSAKNILLLVQRNQILLSRSYFLREHTPGRMSM